MFRGRVALLAFALVLAHAVPACIGGAERGTKLNPQPLPPSTGDDVDEDPNMGGGASGSPEASDAAAVPPDGGPDAQDAGPE